MNSSSSQASSGSLAISQLKTPPCRKLRPSAILDAPRSASIGSSARWMYASVAAGSSQIRSARSRVAGGLQRRTARMSWLHRLRITSSL